MLHPEHLQLMYSVLDAEASAAELRELDRILASDASARAQFEALRRVFQELERVPELNPPPGLLASVVPRFDERPPQPQPRSKPFWRSRVSSLEFAGKPRSPNPDTTTLSRDMTMNQRTPGFSSKRQIWIGIGVAAVAVVLVGHYLLDFPSSGENAGGTIVPAERYRAPQIKPEDVKLGDQSVTQLMQTDTYERLVKDPQFRALAQSASFQTLSQNPAALQALAQNAHAFAALADKPAAFAAMAANPQAFAALAQNPAAFAALAQSPAAMQALAQNPAAFAAVAPQPAALAAM